jgi:hypothetical protein
MTRCPILVTGLNSNFRGPVLATVRSHIRQASGSVIAEVMTETRLLFFSTHSQPPNRSKSDAGGRIHRM